MTNNRAESFIVCGGIILSFAMILFPEISLAGTGGEELQGVYDKTLAIAQGYGGKTIAIVSFISSAIAAVRGSIIAFGSAFGIGVAVGVGPSMVTSGISALI